MAVTLDERSDVTGQDVLLVEDIVDTGTTARRLLDVFQDQSPASLRVCALINKPSRRVMPVKIDYVGFTVPRHQMSGWLRLDLDQKWRHLPAI